MSVLLPWEKEQDLRAKKEALSRRWRCWYSKESLREESNISEDSILSHVARHTGKEGNGVPGNLDA